MEAAIGILAAQHVAAGLVEGNKVSGSVRTFPESSAKSETLQGMPAENIAQCIREQIEVLGKGREVGAIGVGFPGIIRDGIIQESPNLQQVKGLNLQSLLASALQHNDTPVPVRIFNDADVMAAGIAATRGHLDRVVRVWTLGEGIGFGRYPWTEGVWEGGHTVVTLDPKENLCSCGGRGHLEGIMGHRSIRLRFLDMEPEEVFAAAREGDTRCIDFVKLWHRALAAATASNIHMEGPGKFYVSGPNAKFLDAATLDHYVHQMVKMSPLQGSAFEVISTTDEVGIIGAAVNAERATMDLSG
jgi:predicted NBD/HSP70 family sugar kinase